MIMILFPAPLLVLSLSSEDCPKYTCSSSNTTEIDEVCISQLAANYDLIPCSYGLTCEIPGPNQESTCSNLTSSSPLSFPGEKCNEDSDCITSKCLGSHCSGSPEGDPCTKTRDCDIGLACKSSVCILLKEIDEKGCRNDYDCVNNAGCSYISTSTYGVCTEYFSLSDYTEVKYCYGNKNPLCKSGTCSNNNDTLICLPELSNTLQSPYECIVSDYCYSEEDDVTGTILKGKCECSLDGKSYCSLFPGDPETYDYKVHRKAWLNTKEIHKCHSERRFSTECMDDVWDSKKYSYWYYENYVNLYAQTRNADACSLSMYYPSYSEVMLTFTSSFGGVLAFGLGAYLVI